MASPDLKRVFSGLLERLLHFGYARFSGLWNLLSRVTGVSQIDVFSLIAQAAVGRTSYDLPRGERG
jgi:hypothetical protein